MHTAAVGCALTSLLAAAATAQPTAAAPPGQSPDKSAITREDLVKEVPPLPPKADQRPATAAPAIERPPANGAPAPESDPELSQSLGPLNQFDVHEVDVAPPPAEGADVKLRYDVQVQGLDAVDSRPGVDLRSRFDELSALRKAKGSAANEAMLRARLSEDAQLLQALLESQGWYSASVSTRIDREGAGKGQPLVAVLQVTPGARYAIGSIHITAQPTRPAGLIEDNLPVQVGDPIVAETIQAAEANVAVALPQHGYPFATVGQRDVLLDADTHLGDYTLPVTTGPLSRFGGFRTAGKLAFGSRHVGVIARFKRGELYDSRKVDDLRQALIATGLFDTVSVEPEHSGQFAPDGTEYVTMHVEQDAGPLRTLAATAGYQTGQGFRLEGSWTHRNFSRPEGALIIAAVAGTSEQSGNVTFRRSNAGKRDRTFQINLSAARTRYDAFDALTGQLSARLSYDSTPIWRKPVTWAIGAEIIGTAERDWDFDADLKRRRKFLIGGISGQLGVDRTDSLLDPTRGFRAQLLVEPEAALSDKTRPYVRGQLDGSVYLPAADDFVFAGRLRLGSSFGIDRNDLAPSRRFYGGGGGSVRGFGYQQLGPKDPSGDPAGGLSLVEGSVEARYRFGDYGVVGFVDAGQAYVDRVPSFSDIRVGVGIGARYYTNFGPLRIDVATPLARRPGESRINVYVSIGQAF